jgi:hypothetical protein
MVTWLHGAILDSYQIRVVVAFFPEKERERERKKKEQDQNAPKPHWPLQHTYISNRLILERRPCVNALLSTTAPQAATRTHTQETQALSSASAAAWAWPEPQPESTPPNPILDFPYIVNTTTYPRRAASSIDRSDPQVQVVGCLQPGTLSAPSLLLLLLLSAARARSSPWYGIYR